MIAVMITQTNQLYIEFYIMVSYGFHYPVSTYASALRKALKPGGHVLLTVRKGMTHYHADKKAPKRITVDPKSEIKQLEDVGLHCTTRLPEYAGAPSTTVLCTARKR